MNPAVGYAPDGSWISGGFFRSLSADAVVQFQRYAEENDPPSDDWSFIHPVCREVWLRRELCGGLTVCHDCGNDQHRRPPCQNCGSDNMSSADDLHFPDCEGCALPDSRRIK